MTSPILKWTTSPVLRVSLLLLLGVVAFEASAERRCEQPRSETGRTCTIDVCVGLQDVVNARCKGAGAPTDCSDLLAGDCAGFRVARAEWEACGAARFKINKDCWRGGDKDHKDKVSEATAEATKCTLRLALECGEPCP